MSLSQNSPSYLTWFWSLSSKASLGIGRPFGSWVNNSDSDATIRTLWLHCLTELQGHLKRAWRERSLAPSGSLAHFLCHNSLCWTSLTWISAASERHAWKTTHIPESQALWGMVLLEFIFNSLPTQVLDLITIMVVTVQRGPVYPICRTLLISDKTSYLHRKHLAVQHPQSYYLEPWAPDHIFISEETLGRVCKTHTYTFSYILKNNRPFLWNYRYLL